MEYYRKGQQIAVRIDAGEELIFMAENGIYPHIHVTAADENMNIKGGHLISCSIGAIAELLITLAEFDITRSECNDLKLGLMQFGGEK